MSDTLLATLRLLHAVDVVEDDVGRLVEGAVKVAARQDGRRQDFVFEVLQVCFGGLLCGVSLLRNLIAQ